QKSGVTEELVRLAVGLEATDDTLRELDKAIATATGVERQLHDDEAHVQKWLLSSPFDRADGGLRQKTIVVIGSDNVQDQVNGLKAAGFDVHEYDLASKAPENTDCVWFADREIGRA